MNTPGRPLDRSRFDVALKHEVTHSLRRRVPLSLLLLEVRDPVVAADDAAPAGQYFLSHVTAAIALGLREQDNACRYELRRFAVILPDTGSFEAQAIARRICANVAVFAEGDGPRNHELRPTVSIGLAAMTPGAASASHRSLFAAADRAREVAREIGGICVVEGALPADG